MCVKVFIDLHNVGVRVEKQRRLLTDDLGEVNDSRLVFASQPSFHAILLPFEQFVEIFGLLVARRGRVVEGRSDAVRHGH